MLSSKNPNNFDDEDIQILHDINKQLLYAEQLLQKQTYNSDQTIAEKSKLYLVDNKKLLYIIEEFLCSFTCKPINGLVIYRDRVKFQKILMTMKNNTCLYK